MGESDLSIDNWLPGFSKICTNRLPVHYLIPGVLYQNVSRDTSKRVHSQAMEGFASKCATSLDHSSTRNTSAGQLAANHRFPKSARKNENNRKEKDKKRNRIPLWAKWQMPLKKLFDREGIEKALPFVPSWASLLGKWLANTRHPAASAVRKPKPCSGRSLHANGVTPNFSGLGGLSSGSPRRFRTAVAPSFMGGCFIWSTGLWPIHMDMSQLADIIADSDNRWGGWVFWRSSGIPHQTLNINLVLPVVNRINDHSMFYVQIGKENQGGILLILLFRFRYGS